MHLACPGTQCPDPARGTPSFASYGAAGWKRACPGKRRMRLSGVFPTVGDEHATSAIEKFIAIKNKLAPGLTQTGFLFYSENGFTQNQEKLMQANGIMYTTFKKLTSK